MDKVVNILFHRKKYARERTIYTMNEKETLQYVEELKRYGIVPGLDSMKRLCQKLGDPQEMLRFIHIAGTNGKGSVLALLSTVLWQGGYRVGRYSSPAVFSYYERIWVNGRPIPKRALCDCMTRVKEACDALTAEGFPHPTVYEAETAAAFLYFRDCGCDIVVLETGMGGREDATNLIQNTLAAVFTPIGMDHMQFLGDTPEKIAGQKAGIIKNGCYVISAHQEDAVLTVLREEAEAKGCPFIVVGEVEKPHYGLEEQSFSYTDANSKKWEKLKISLAGMQQPENASLVLEVLSCLAKCGYSVAEAKLRAGFLKTVWPGRFQILSKKPLFVVDGAHNEQAAKKLAQSVRFYFTNKRIIYIMGILRDKEYEKIVEETYRYAEHIITVTPPENKRALEGLTLAQTVREYHPAVTVADSLEEAVEMAYLLAGKEDVILCFGSLSYLARAAELVEKELSRMRGKKGGRKDHG